LKTVLLAEHHAPTLDHVRGLLIQAGYSVRAASDPGRAMELFVSEHPDFVVVAVELPRLDGAHLGKLIRGSDHGSRVPMVAIDKGHLGKARGVGAILDLKANAYVADPTRPGELVGKLLSLAGVAQLARQSSAKGISATLSRAPVAAGDLKGYPLPALLTSCYRLKRNGILVIAHRDLTRRVFFSQGSAVSYDSTARQDALPTWMHERQELDENQARSVLEALAGGQRPAVALAHVGVELGGEELLNRLRDYTRDKVAQVVGMREGRYAFYSGTEFADEISRVDVHALSPVLHGARRSFPVKVFAQPLRVHLSQFPYRTPDFGKDLAVLGLDTGDLKLAMQMNGRIRLNELIAHGRAELRTAYSLLWFLSLAGDVAFSPEPVAGAEGTQLTPTADRIAPRRRKPLPPELVTELRDAAVKIITGSYFRVLGLDIAADTEAVEKAYHQIATRFHPDSYPDYDSSEIKDLLDSVQDKLSASYRVLSVESKRKAYLQYLLGKLDVGRTAAVHVDAEIALKRGDAALKRKDARSAMAAFEEAIALNPREPEYYCYLAWATWLAEKGDKKERARAAQKLLKKALAINATLERATIISAIIDGETGEATSARKRLLKVLEQNPHSQLARAALRKVGR
jgi:CheY-like chemotaxis protein